MSQYTPYVEERAVTQLAKSLAEYDGNIILKLGSDDWEPRQLPDSRKIIIQKSKQDYEWEARRFLHCFLVVKNLSDLRQL